MKVERDLMSNPACAKGSSHRCPLRSTSWNPADANVARVLPLSSFQAHLDSIVTCFCADVPPGLMTVGNDGYLRIWAPEGDIIGEICLPNVDDARKAQR